MFIHDQTPPKGRASLPTSVPMKLPFYTPLPLRLLLDFESESGHLPFSLAIWMCSKDVEEAYGVANHNQNTPEGRSQLPS